MKKERLTFKNNYASLACFCYLLSIIIINQVDNIITTCFYYIALLLCVNVNLLRTKKIFPRSIIFFIYSVALLGYINLIYIGNLKFLNYLIVLLSCLAAGLFIDNSIKTEYYLAIFYINVIIILYHFFRYGITEQVYVESSNNYVSIHLLLPSVLYYALKEKRNEIPSILPAFILLFLSLLARGRGGFLASMILFLGVALKKYSGLFSRPQNRLLLWCATIVVVIPLLIVFFPYFMSKISSLGAIHRFMERGLNGDGRLACWKEYILSSLNSLPFFLFGSRLEKLWWAVHYSGNLHNSFFLIHAYLGICGLAFIVIQGVRCILFGIKNQRWIYLACLLAFLFRGLTDQVFGCNRNTIILLAMYLLPEYELHEQRGLLSDRKHLT